MQATGTLFSLALNAVLKFQFVTFMTAPVLEWESHCGLKPMYIQHRHQRGFCLGQDAFNIAEPVPNGTAKAGRQVGWEENNAMIPIGCHRMLAKFQVDESMQSGLDDLSNFVCNQCIIKLMFESVCTHPNAALELPCASKLAFKLCNNTGPVPRLLSLRV